MRIVSIKLYLNRISDNFGYSTDHTHFYILIKTSKAVCAGTLLRYLGVACCEVFEDLLVSPSFTRRGNRQQIQLEDSC